MIYTVPSYSQIEQEATLAERGRILAALDAYMEETKRELVRPRDPHCVELEPDYSAIMNTIDHVVDLVEGRNA